MTTSTGLSNFWFGVDAPSRQAQILQKRSGLDYIASHSIHITNHSEEDVNRFQHHTLDGVSFSWLFASGLVSGIRDDRLHVMEGMHRPGFYHTASIRSAGRRGEARSGARMAAPCRHSAVIFTCRRQCATPDPYRHGVASCFSDSSAAPPFPCATSRRSPGPPHCPGRPADGLFL